MNEQSKWLTDLAQQIDRARTMGDLQAIVDQGVELGFNEIHVKAAVRRRVRRNINQRIRREQE